MLFNLTAIEDALEPLVQYRHPSIAISPIILCLPPAARQARLNEYTALSHSIVETVNAMKALESKLGLIRRDLESRAAFVQNAMAPVSALPTETLRLIFQLALESSRSAITLSHVCSRWRSVSVNFSRLWTRIRIPTHWAATKYNKVLVNLSERAGHMPISFHASISECSPHSLVASITAAPQNDTNPPQDENPLLGRNIDNVMLAARRFAEIHIHPAFAHIRRLTLEHLTISELYEMNQLTELSIGSCDVEVVWDILHRVRAPHLERLNFFDLFVCPETDPEHFSLEMRAFVFPNVQHLFIENCEDSACFVLCQAGLYPILKSFEQIILEGTFFEALDQGTYYSRLSEFVRSSNRPKILFDFHS